MLCFPGVDVIIVGSGWIFVIDGKDAAPSLLTSSPHRDNIRMKDEGRDVCYSSQCLGKKIMNRQHNTTFRRMEEWKIAQAGRSRFEVV